MSVISFSAVGPIGKKFEVEVPEAGIVELSGDQGFGKSTALKVIDAAINGRKPGELGITPTDGEERGEADILGVHFVFTQKRARADGRLESYIALKGGEAFARIVDPQIKDVDRADAQRLKDICDVLGIKGDAEAMREAIGLAPDDPTFEEYFEAPRGSIVDWADAGRRKINKAALDMERLAAETKARAESEERQARELKALGAGGNEDEAQAELEAAIAAEATVKAALAARDQLKAMADCRETEVILEDIRAVDLEAAPYCDKVSALQSERDATQRQIAELEARVAEIGKQLIAAAGDRDEFNKRKRAPLEEELNRANKRDKALEASKIDMTPEDAAAAVAAARKKRAATMNTPELTRLEASAAEAKVQVPVLEKAAETLRGQARKVDDAITAAVQKNVPGVVVVDGGLYVNDHPRRAGNVRFEELSKGERVRRVIRLMVTAGRINSAFVIPQESWEGVSPAGKQEVLEECLAHGILAFTGKVGEEQELTAEIYDGK